MAATVPGYSNYQTEPFTVALTTVPVALTSGGNWSPAMGATAILLIQMPADTEQIAICVSTFTGTTADIPDNALLKAKHDSASSTFFSLTSLPIRFTDWFNGNVMLVGNGTITAICQFIPITEAGD